MSEERSKATDDAAHTAEAGLANQFLERLAERIGGHASVRAVFGEPIERGDLVVIPVARVRWGVGGGAGSAGESVGGPDSGSGSGGGGGVAADPVGYLEIRPTGATFQPIVPPYPSPVLVLAAGLAAAFILRALARVARR
jgi:sporulation protein YtfJ